MILYLTYWFPAERRGRMTALFMTAVPLAGVIGGPFSGWILQAFSGVHGWAGWQWLFLLEGIPSVVVGLFILVYLNDGIDDARWLSDGEKQLLKANIKRDCATKTDVSLRGAFLNPRVWLFCLIYFCIVMGLYGVSFWLPTIIKATGVKNALDVGLLTAIPYGVATVAMVLFGRSADLRKERRWHIAIPSILGGIGLLLSVIYSGNTVMAMTALSLATLGIITALPLFWSCPTALLTGTAAAGGIALINSVGNLAGFVSPYMMGFIKDLTQSTNTGMYVLAGCMLLVAVLTIAGVPAKLVNK
jgi:sugar phosphate permease